ncbi:MAG: peptidoglycan DD-metalloendopeptidase family protein [Actinomycetota bacterium]
MRSRITAVVMALMVLAPPALAQTEGRLTQDDVDAALSQRRAAGAELEDLTARYQQSLFDEEIVRERVANLAKSVSDLEREIGAKSVRVSELVLTRYMAGSPLGTERVFAASSFLDVPVQAEYYRMMNEQDLALLNSLEASEKLHVEQQRKLDKSLEDQKALVADLKQMSAELLVALAAADRNYNEVAAAFQKQEEERKAREEAERRRAAEAAAAAAAATTTTVATPTTTLPATTTTQPSAITTTTEPVTTTTVAPAGSDTSGDSTTTSAPAATTTTLATTTTQPAATTTTTSVPPPPVDTSGKTCPINAATSFSDTWGAARSGGRFHMGVDITAVRNAPVVAIEAGTVTRTSNSSLGGLSIYLTGNSGSQYYYAHLEYIEAGITGGTRVSVGQLLGGNGSSGNAPDWIPHVHFQYAPPGFGWVNPYPLVKALCG